MSFLKGIPAEQTQALYLLGDIWDFWYEYRDVVPRGYVKVFSALMNLMESGVRVFFFAGNHDIWCYSYFRELGMSVLEQPYQTTIGGSRFLLGHGDGLGEGMRFYKIMRWAFHFKPFQAMFSCLHPWLAFRFGNGWSKHSRLAKSIPYQFRGEDEPLYRYSLKMSAEVKYFIYGHYHSSVRMTFPSGSQLLILKDWMDSSPYAVFDGEQLLTFSS